MEVSELTRIGRLGKCEHGYFRVMLKPAYRSLMQDIEECFLIFNSDRVFYVSISDKKWLNDQLYCRFEDDGVEEERNRHREVYLAIEPEVEAWVSESEGLIGYTAVAQEQEIGVISDFFGNELQQVLVIKTPTGAEIMVPQVDFYIAAVVPSTRTVIFQNLELLLEQ